MPNFKDGVLGLLAETFRRIPDILLISAALVVLFAMFAIALMAAAPD